MQTIDVTQLKRQLIEIHGDLHEDEVALDRMMDHLDSDEQLIAGYTVDLLRTANEPVCEALANILGGDLTDPDVLMKMIHAISVMVPVLGRSFEAAFAYGFVVGREHKRRGYDA